MDLTFSRGTTGPMSLEGWYCPACGHEVVLEPETDLWICQGCDAPFSEEALTAIYARILLFNCAWPTAYFKRLLQEVVDLLNREDG